MLRRLERSVWTFSLVLLLVVGPQASAHSVGIYAPRFWTNTTPGWKFAPTFPSGEIRTRMLESAARWNSITGVGFSFDFNGEGGSGQSFNDPCGNDYNAVIWSTLVAFGGGKWCFSPTSHAITQFVLAIEQRSDWKTSSSDPGTHWVETVGTHEFGHAWGFGTGIFESPPGPMHFEANLTICVNDSTYHTMCDGLLPVPSKTMSLEQHDIETFRNRY